MHGSDLIWSIPFLHFLLPGVNVGRILLTRVEMEAENFSNQNDPSIPVIQQQPSIRARNQKNSMYEPAVNLSALGVEDDQLAMWQLGAVERGDLTEPGDSSSFLPHHSEPGYMDSVLHQLYSGVGRMRVLDMSEIRLVRSYYMFPFLLSCSRMFAFLFVCHLFSQTCISTPQCLVLSIFSVLPFLFPSFPLLLSVFF